MSFNNPLNAPSSPLHPLGAHSTSATAASESAVMGTHTNIAQNGGQETSLPMSIALMLRDTEAHSKEYHAFKTHVRSLGDIVYHRMLACHSSIRSFRRHMKTIAPHHADENAITMARTIFSTYLTKASMPLDTPTYNPLRFLAPPAAEQQVAKLDNLLSNSSGGLFTNTGYESETTTNPLNTSGNSIPIDFTTMVTPTIFDRVEEYIINKLEPEFQRFAKTLVSPTAAPVHAGHNILEAIKELDLSPTNHHVSNNGGTGNRKLDFTKLAGELAERDSYPVYYIDYFTGEIIPSMLFISTFRFMFVSKLTNQELLWVPLTTVYRIDRINHPRADQAMCMYCKDFRRIEFFIIPKEIYPMSDPAPNVDHTLPLLGRLRTAAFVDPSSFFALKFTMPPTADPMTDDGWRSYDLFSEFIRQELNFKHWRTSEVNCEYTTSPTYPGRLVAPDIITDDELRICANFRSKGRLPTVCWVSRGGVPLARSSQPMVGITRARCMEDERLVDLIRATCPTGRPLHLLDARPKANAIANVAKGMGYELTYNCVIEFLGIGNIHTMRESANKLESFVHSSSDEGWLGALEATKWLEHLRAVLVGSMRIVELVQSGNPVLLHCSDGWDRTSQLSSLGLLMLDSYYRTFRGFQVLIEKEWLSYGHMFQNRVRHGDKNAYADSQRSPIFLQFIDCVHQLMMHYHDMFEFNEHYLIAVLDALYSCQFGTFLGNNERERMALRGRTVSLWTYLNTIKSQFMNPFYDASKTGVPSPLPLWRSEHVYFWRTYYLRYWRTPTREPSQFQK
eukprot:gene5726-6622_t